MALQGDVWFDVATVVLKCTYGYFKVMYFFSQGNEQDCNKVVTDYWRYRLFCALQSSPGMLESCALVINCRIWELMRSTLEKKRIEPLTADGI